MNNRNKLLCSALSISDPSIIEELENAPDGETFNQTCERLCVYLSMEGKNISYSTVRETALTRLVSHNTSVGFLDSIDRHLCIWACIPVFRALIVHTGNIPQAENILNGIEDWIAGKQAISRKSETWKYPTWLDATQRKARMTIYAFRNISVLPVQVSKPGFRASLQFCFSNLSEITNRSPEQYYSEMTDHVLTFPAANPEFCD